MLDRLGRQIDYMRISVTERCNLRCRYCMPNGIVACSHDDVLTYEELLRVCKAAVELGIVNFKVTGGEPLVRRGCVDFIARLKYLSGVAQVTLTTNGLLLSDELDALCAAGIDGLNISVNTLDKERYNALTGADGAEVELGRRTISECAERGVKTKVNAVLLEETFDDIIDIAKLALENNVDVRFIELMPIGEGAAVSGVSMGTALSRLREAFPDLHPTDEKRGNGPARYFASEKLKGRIGFIGAMSHMFCNSCNRVRLTSTGSLKPCLCFEEGVDLRQVLRGDGTDAQLLEAMRTCIEDKPRSHCFSERQSITEHKAMHRIGG